MDFYDVPGYFLIDSTYRKVLKFSGVKASRNDQLILGTKKTIKNFKWNSSCLYMYKYVYI